MAQKIGLLAKAILGVELPLRVISVPQFGAYIGTMDDTGPCSRESDEYWHDHQQAQHALDSDAWTQRAYCGGGL